MDDIKQHIDLHLTRRQFFGVSAQGIGIGALASLLGPEMLAAGLDQARDPKTGGLRGLPHVAPSSLPMAAARTAAVAPVSEPARAGSVTR